MKNKIALYIFTIATFLSAINVANAQPSYEFSDAIGGIEIVGGSTLAFGSQEVLLVLEQEYYINNTTIIGNLNICEIVLEQSGPLDFTPQWSLEVRDNLDNLIADPTMTIASGFPLKVTAIFNPDVSTTGYVPALLSIKSNVSGNCGGTPENRTFVLGGTAIRTAVNYSLVLDRSGSMRILEDDGLGGMKRRIDLLSEASDYFMSLEYLRVEDMATGFAGDQIGIVKYNSTVDDIYLPLSIATNTLITDTKNDLLSTVATNDASLIQPMGGTATGDAVIASINNQLTALPVGSEKNVIIMFSDGYENVGSLITDAVPGSVSSEISMRPDINIYSIGMGAANMGSLNAYSDQSGLASPQSFFYDPTQDPMALTSFFFKIYQNAIGLSSAVDPTFYVNLTDTAWVDISDVMISSDDNQITISVSFPEDVNEATDFRILQPSGSILTDGLVNGINTQQIDGRNHIIYQVTPTASANATDFVGQWKLQGRGTSVVIVNATDSTATATTAGKGERQSPDNEAPDLTNVPVGFAVASLSNVTFELEAGSIDNAPGEELVVTTEVEDTSTPEANDVEVQDIDITVTTPDGKEVNCPPVKDECTGVYVVRYPYTQKEGTYQVYAKATIKNAKGEITSRDAMKQVVISNQNEILSADQPAKDDVHKWFKTAIIIIIILLILILLLLLRKKKD